MGKWFLATQDAHDLYRQFGFIEVMPDFYMEKNRRIIMNNNRDTMKGVIMTGYGDYDKLNYREDLPMPKPQFNQVLVKVAAAGINNTDVNTRIGWYGKKDNDMSGWGGAITFPRIQGADVCGHIVAVGDNVDKNRIGERIIINPCLWYVNAERLERPWYFGSECDGGFAEYTVVDSGQAFAINSDYSDVELASFPCSYSTAENMLIRANVSDNDTVLVTGASGGVGSAAVQLAVARGATVIGICGESKANVVKQLGASEIVNRGESVLDKLGENRVDVVIDLVGGETWGELLEVLKPKGRYAVAGAIAGAMVNLDLRTVYLKDLSFLGCMALENEAFPNLVKRIENKQISPVIAGVFPLKEIVAAQKQFLTKQSAGNIVLTVTE